MAVEKSSMSTETLVSTTLAGMTASIVESYVTYPLEYLKVREQIALRPKHLLEKFEIPNYTKLFYKGSSAFVLGNMSKTVLRFSTYNWATKVMLDSRDSETITAPQVVLAGIMTGIVESVLVVPFENIKTTMIEASSVGSGHAKGCLAPPGSEAAHRAFNPVMHAAESASHNAGKALGPRTVRPPAPRPHASSALYEILPQFRVIKTVREMVKQRGLRSLVQGFNPTILRQILNSGTRFTTYNFLSQLLVPDETKGISLTLSVILAGCASLSEAVITQPLDVVKSRMQTTNGIKLYGNSLMCSYRIFAEEGVHRLWAGLVPRWLRIWLSGGLMFVVYEQSNRVLSSGMKENPFAWK